jgi:DNA (cytosine-5)-methyltransferase 1
LHVAGDGVAVPVVRWLAQELLEPLLAESSAMAAE